MQHFRGPAYCKYERTGGSASRGVLAGWVGGLVAGVWVGVRAGENTVAAFTLSHMMVQYS